MLGIGYAFLVRSCGGLDEKAVYTIVSKVTLTLVRIAYHSD